MARSLDARQSGCYQFIREHEDDIHVFPAIAWFEWQATLSRMERDGKKTLRDIYLIDAKNFNTFDLSEDIANRFIHRQAD
jgi:hypothetical protein